MKGAAACGSNHQEVPIEVARRIDPRCFNNLIDANVLDRLDDGHDQAVEEILALSERGEITLMLPHSVKAEIEHPHTRPKVKARAKAVQFTMPVTLTPNELELHRKVRDLIRGYAKPGKHDSDAYHIVEAAKYGRYFVTREHRLLRKSAEVSALLGSIAVISPTDFVRL